METSSRGHIILRMSYIQPGTQFRLDDPERGYTGNHKSIHWTADISDRRVPFLAADAEHAHSMSASATPW